MVASTSICPKSILTGSLKKPPEIILPLLTAKVTRRTKREIGLRGLNMGIRVMLETNTLKFAATKLQRLIPVNRPTYNEKGEMTGILLYEDGYINPNERITDPDLKKQADLLPQIAELAKSGKFELLLDREADYESWGLPHMNSATGLFYDAPVSEAERPLKYGRILVGMGIPAEEWAKQFLTSIQNKRFRNLAKILGAYQGENKYNLNQLRDAYYVWSAEHNNCEYMLTMDFKLIRMISQDRKHDVRVKVVRPSELLEQT